MVRHVFFQILKVVIKIIFILKSIFKPLFTINICKMKIFQLYNQILLKRANSLMHIFLQDLNPKMYIKMEGIYLIIFEFILHLTKNSEQSKLKKMC